MMLFLADSLMNQNRDFMGVLCIVFFCFRLFVFSFFRGGVVAVT